MTTDIKLESKFSVGAADALYDHARPLYDRLGATRVGIVELRSSERVTPGPEEDKTPSVKLRIVGLEIAGPDQEGAVREAQRALHLQRTAMGTLNEDGQIDLTRETIRLTGGLLADLETARLRAALQHWATEARKVVHSRTLLDGEIRHELDRIAEGMDAALHPARQDGDES